MDGIRVISKRLYDRRKNRFQSPAFTNSSSGGISIIDKQCICTSNERTCFHIKKYYSDIADEPIIFWQFETDILPNGCHIDYKVSTTGDMCHCDIEGLGNNEARRFFIDNTKDLSSLYICVGDCARPLTVDDLI